MQLQRLKLQSVAQRNQAAELNTELESVRLRLEDSQGQVSQLQSQQQEAAEATAKLEQVKLRLEESQSQLRSAQLAIEAQRRSCQEQIVQLKEEHELGIGRERCR